MKDVEFLRMINAMKICSWIVRIAIQEFSSFLLTSCYRHINPLMEDLLSLHIEKNHHGIQEYCQVIETTLHKIRKDFSKTRESKYIEHYIYASIRDIET